MINGATLTHGDLVGTWQLHKAMERRDGVVSPNPNYGPSPSGFLHYLADGRVSVIIANGGRQCLSTSGRRDAPAAELAQSARSFDAYAGRYTLIAPDRIVHHVEISSFQNDVGTDLPRHVTRDGDLLRLTLDPVAERGTMVTRWLEWRRLPLAG